MTQAFKLKTDSTIADAKAGTIVYKAAGFDFGLAADDTRFTGVEHVSVSLRRGGAIPTFTHPLRDLEPTEVEELPPITEEHVNRVCLFGQGPKTCRYLAVGPSGWACMKADGNAASRIDLRVIVGEHVAKGDNCDGRSDQTPAQTGQST